MGKIYALKHRLFLFIFKMYYLLYNWIKIIFLHAFVTFCLTKINTIKTTTKIDRKL